jgi:hypothetical protein
VAATERSHGRMSRPARSEGRMNKVITTAAVILCLAGSAHAGEARTSHGRSNLAASTHTILLGVDADFALPMSTYGDFNGVGGGALLNVEYPLIEQLSLTARAGFQYHADKTPPGAPTTVSSHIHSIPVLLGAKYYVMQTDRQGLFGAAEMGMFDLMTNVSGPVSGSSNDVKFGIGAGVGYQWNQWNARVNLHSHDVGHFGDFLVVSGGIGYQFAGF